MKASRTLVAALVTLGLSTAVAAQDAESDDLFRQAMTTEDLAASDFIGMRVHASQMDSAADVATTDSSTFEDVGEINDLIFTRDGSIDAVIVDIGGFLGIGERQVAIGMSSLEFRDVQETDYEGDFLLVIPASQAILESAPEYDRSIIEERLIASQVAPMPEEGIQSAEVAPLDSSPRVTGVTDPNLMDGYEPIPVDLVTGEQLAGARVYSASDGDIGEVSEFLLQGDSVSQVIIDVGGFLGIGEKPVALDMAELEVLQFPDDGEVRVRVQMDKEQLEALPEHE